MERTHILLFSLLLICLTDCVLFIAYISTVYIVASRNIRSLLRSCRIAFRRLLCLLCLLQAIFLNIAFASISLSIYGTYGTQVPQYRLGLILSLGLFTLGELGTLGLAIYSHLKYIPVRRVRMRYVWLSHELLSGSTVFTIVAWYLNGVDLSNEIVLVWIAIVLFEAGFGFWIYAVVEGESTYWGLFPPREISVVYE